MTRVLAATVLLCLSGAFTPAHGQSARSMEPCERSGFRSAPRLMMASLGQGPHLARYEDAESAVRAVDACAPQRGDASPGLKGAVRDDGSRAAEPSGIITNRAEWVRTHDEDRPFGFGDAEERALEMRMRIEDAQLRAYAYGMRRYGRSGVSRRPGERRGSRLGIRSALGPGSLWSHDACSSRDRRCR